MTDSIYLRGWRLSFKEKEEMRHFNSITFGANQLNVNFGACLTKNVGLEPDLNLNHLTRVPTVIDL